MIPDRFFHSSLTAMWTRRWLAAAVAFLALCQSANAQFLTSELRSLSRAGGQVGTSFEVRAKTGTNLDELEALIFSHPGISAELATLDPLPFSQERRPDFGNFTVTIAADVPPGRYDVRVAGRHGVSNPRTFLVTKLPMEMVTGVSHSIDAATELKPDTVFQAQSTAAEIDYFQFAAHKGESYRIELLCHQIDSRMIGQLILFDPSQRQIAIAHGSDDIDPVLQFEAETEGVFRVAIHDFTFRGGDEFPYQVALLDSESNTDPLPTTDASRANWLTRAFNLPANQLLHTDHSAPASSNEPLRIEIPTTLTRAFPDDHRDTVFQFTAEKDQQIAIDVVSHRLGEPTDPRMIVQRIEPVESGAPKFHTVLNVDDSQSLSDGAINLTTKDPAGLLKIPVSAEYRVIVRDLDVGRTLRDRQSFQVRVGSPNPGFDLIAYRMYPDKDVNASQPIGTKLYRGGAEVIRVLAIRRDGWRGTIRVNVENLPEGVSASETIISADQTQTQIVLQATDDAPANITAIDVVGTSEDGTMQSTAVPATITWGKGVGRDYIRSRLAQQLMIAVSAEDLSPLTITLGDGNVAEVKKGQAVTVPVKLVRRDGGATNVVLRARDFPPGVSGKDVTIAADKNEGNLEVKTGNTPPGTYSLWLQAETKIKVKPNPQVLQRAQSYRASLQKLHDDPGQAANLEAIKAAIAEADKAVEAAKPLAAERELTVYLPTSNATLRVIEP